MQNFRIIGLAEPVTIVGKKKEKTLMARIDTGAAKCSIDISLIRELGLGPAIGKTTIKNVHGRSKRLVYPLSIIINGILLKTECTATDRKSMRYKVLIGQNALKKGNFLIDPNKGRKK